MQDFFYNRVHRVVFSFTKVKHLTTSIKTANDSK